MISYFQDLGHPSTDLHETLGMYRIHPEIMQRHISDFRPEVKTGNEPSPYNIGIDTLLSGKISGRNNTNIV